MSVSVITAELFAQLVDKDWMQQVRERIWTEALAHLAFSAQICVHCGSSPTNRMHGTWSQLGSSQLII